MSRLFGILAGVVLIAPLAGCESDLWTKPESPVLHKPYHRYALNRYYEPMAENAAATNLVFADGYFHPHTSEINSLGETQLDRMSLSLERFGGTVMYETRVSDEDLVDRRVAAVRQYFTDTGMDMDGVTVASGLSRGKGMWAGDAIIAAEKAAKASDKSSTVAQKERELGEDG
jgi:hypothetical protein